MRVYQTNEIKNIALLGSAGSGKTTLAESMLFEAGVIKRRGSVEAKNTVSDYFPVELEYGFSVFPTVFHEEWNNKKLNIIDFPGSEDELREGIRKGLVTRSIFPVFCVCAGKSMGVHRLMEFWATLFLS